MALTLPKATSAQVAMMGILSSHDVSCWITLDGRLKAIEVVITADNQILKTTLDMTDWSPAKVYQWLGY